MKPLSIVVGGYIVGYPLGGMTWHHLNYLAGLVELGHRVTFLEDGAYLSPFDPVTGLSGDPTYGIRYLQESLASAGLDIPFHYRFGTISAGLSIPEMDSAVAHADLFIAVSGITPIDWYPIPKRSVAIDTDPVFTQLRMNDDSVLLNYYKSFSTVATFGRLIGTPACPLPTHCLNWIPTNQPISLTHWPDTVPASRNFTTLGKWEHAADRHLEFNGKKYRSSKGVEWMKVRDLPRRVSWPMEMAMAGMPVPTRESFEHARWKIVDPAHASATCAGYQQFIQNSAGEFTVAKEIYAGLPSGWFSDRSAAFLASGRPVVTQASGFDQWLPTGAGLFSFTTCDEAVAALQTIAGDYASHARAARAIAQEYFDSSTVLTALIDQAMSNPR